MRALPQILTERLALGPLCPGDGPIVRQLAGDAAVASTTLHVPHPYEAGMAQQWISRHESAFEEGQDVVLAIRYRDCNCLLGAISLLGIDRQRRDAELDCWLGRFYWNRGYGSEAAAAMIRYGFDELDLRRIYACAFAGHAASRRMLLKVGMRYAGSSERPAIKNGVPQDLHCYEILGAAQPR